MELQGMSSSSADEEGLRHESFAGTGPRFFFVRLALGADCSALRVRYAEDASAGRCFAQCLELISAGRNRRSALGGDDGTCQT